MKRLRLGICIWGLILIGLTTVTVKASSQEGKVVIALDPGHGGEEKGADYYGEREKDINLQIARYVKEGLEQYDGVEVVLTRDDDVELGLKDRADRAASAGADMFISLHCNASASHQSNGASVYISTGEYNRKSLMDFADYFLGEFEAIGLRNAGTFARVTQMGYRRNDGSFQDYYGVLRHAYNNGIPALLVEHCFMDSPKDWKFVRSDEGIKKLADADVSAIVAYYGLKLSDGGIYEGKHAKVYGATSKGVGMNCYDAPKLTGIELVEYDGKTPAVAKYKVSLEDKVGVSSIYLVYKNGSGNSVTVSLMINEPLKTGNHELMAYIPDGMELCNHTLSYVGMYNVAGYDAGYNYAGGSLIGFGKCDWLNEFVYNGVANLPVTVKGELSKAYIKKLDCEINLGIKRRQDVYPVSLINASN
ncbi:MAG: N-acetylmuramoyl-L-alanine amidase [Lachnospiraceae bacterium]|nr:N-acetylmuramoyl-L-alanine amidase [Lachnospiraceae bacterium]